MRILFLTLAIALGAPAAAQEMFKCKNAAGKITYTSRECGELGLSSGGPITGRISGLSAPGPESPAKPKPPAPAGKAPAPSAGSQPRADAEKAPGRNCVTVKLGKGNITTRCDDDPVEAKSKP